VIFTPSGVKITHPAVLYLHQPLKIMGNQAGTQPAD
jgi:hypothetical protein